MTNSIRLLHDKDADSFRTLRLKSYQDDPYAFSESFEDEQLRPLEDFEEEIRIVGEPPEWFVLGAFTDSEDLVGFVKFRRDTRSKGRHKSMIHAMYVDPDYRKYGIGRQLVESVIDRAKEMNLEQIHLWVLHSEHSTSAAKFYKKCGFEGQGPMVMRDLKIGERYIDAEYMVMYLN